jgi:N-acetyl-gamma-glutamyl-phosphate reductase
VPIDPDLDATALVHRAYAGAPLVRLRPGSPELRHVRGSAFADLSVCQEDETAVVLSAIDNLGKGAASQAIQCANLALGLAVDAGLRRAAITP